MQTGLKGIAETLMERQKVSKQEPETELFAPGRDGKQQTPGGVNLQDL